MNCRHQRKASRIYSHPMKRLITWSVLVAGLMAAVPLHAADFTVDERSLLHLGASAVIGAGINQALLAGNAKPTLRRIFSFTTCIGVGLLKEYGFDSAADMGDVFFDSVGCLAGVAITEKLNLLVKKNALTLEGSF